MAHSSQVRVVLDLDIDGDRIIRGSISTADRAVHEFFGWLELADKLEAARASARDDLRAAGRQTQPAPA